MGTALKASESKAQEQEQCLVLTYKEWYFIASSTHKEAALPCLSQGPKLHKAEFRFIQFGQCHGKIGKILF